MFFRSILAALVLSSISSASFAQVPPDLLARAEQGDAEAQIEIGDMYYMAEIVPLNPTEAMKWYRLAADQGDAIGQIKVGLMYHVSRGVGQNFTEARKWYRLSAVQGLAAARGNLAAYSNLSQLHLAGLGGPKSPVKAYAWSWLIEETQVTRYLEEEMTPQQIDEAKAYARDCRENNFEGCD